MKCILTVIVLALANSILAQDVAVMQDPITKPVLSRRCRELFGERAEKIKIQQRLNALLQRSESSLKKTSETKTTMLARLNSTGVKIKNELYLTNLQIESMEEKIIRSGCPGLSLQ